MTKEDTEGQSGHWEPPSTLPGPVGAAPRGRLACWALGLTDLPHLPLPLLTSQPITGQLKIVGGGRRWLLKGASEPSRPRAGRSRSRALIEATLGTKPPFRGAGTSGSHFWRANVSLISLSPARPHPNGRDGQPLATGSLWGWERVGEPQGPHCALLRSTDAPPPLSESGEAFFPLQF